MASLLVRNIDQLVKPDELREFFSKFGDVCDVYIPRDYYTQKSRGFCYVKFLKYDDAREALEKTDGNEVLGKTVEIVFVKEERKAPHEETDLDIDHQAPQEEDTTAEVIVGHHHGIIGETLIQVQGNNILL
ncbi:hypothetical protein SteCoe_35300 [Stentor coeruleus]|uniref:RRM domain-containing protein n=1 Tax=Stentor coeruleus TaxID=5963 RepID=A0A1R2ASK8_9CILI|nr:hypothetical protein SteCoe_35300 [Stentor coeruleus]